MKLELNLYNYVKNSIEQLMGSRGKSKTDANVGFYFYLIRGLHEFGYLPSWPSKKDFLEFKEKDTGSFESFLTRERKNNSARINRALSGSLKRKDDFEKMTSYPTILSSLTILDFIILTEDISNEEVLNLLRPEKDFEE